MTIRISTYQVCDRCQKPFSEQHLKYGDNVPQYERKPLKLTHGDHVVLCYEDLCENCDRVIQGLIKRMKQETEPRRVRQNAPAEDAGSPIQDIPENVDI